MLITKNVKFIHYLRDEVRFILGKDGFIKGKFALMGFSLVAIGFYPVVFLYAKNYNQVMLNELLSPVLFAAGVIIVVSFVTYCYFRNIYKTVFASSVFMIIFWNYALLENGIKAVLPEVKYWHVLPTFMVLYFLFIIVLKNCKLTHDGLLRVNCILGAVFAGLIVFNIFTAVVTQSKVDAKTRESISEKSTSIDINKIGKMNVYYIILDEYSSFEAIKKYYNYDNSPFRDFLKKHGFVISVESHNISNYTQVVVPNLLHYDNIVRNSSDENLRLRENSALMNLFRDNGFSTIDIDMWHADYPAIPRINADTHIELGARSEKSSQFFQMVLTRTFFKFLDIFTTYDDGLYPELRNRRIQFFSSLVELSKEQKGSRFIFAHALCPHEPYLFNEKGEPVDNGLTDYADKKYYLGQYIFVTNRIMDTVNQILENDPECIIILQSDHSNRKLPGTPMYDQTRILNAVYYSGKPFPDINHQSGVNTLRMVLNELFKLKLPMLEDEK